MQGAAQLFEKVNKFAVTTKHGKTNGRLVAASVSGHRILVALETVSFETVAKGRSKTVTYPEGTGFMYHGELGLHQIFPGGMYDMLRSRAHASRGERYESRDMREMGQLTFDFVRRYVSWSLLDEEARRFTDDGIRSLADELVTKRNDRKRTAATRFLKATGLRTKKNGKRMPMPSAFTASAGAYHLGLRREDVGEILRYIDPERIEVFDHVEGVHRRLDDAWRAVRPDAVERPGHAIALAAMHPKSAQAVKVMREALRPVYDGLREIRVRPLDGCAREAAEALRALRNRILRAPSAESVDVTEYLVEARRALARAQAIRTTEMEAISPLSFLLARWRRLDDAQREKVRRRAVELCTELPRTLASREAFFDERTRERFRDGIDMATHLAETRNDEHPRRQLVAVKKTLKKLSASLI